MSSALRALPVCLLLVAGTAVAAPAAAQSPDAVAQSPDAGAAGPEPITATNAVVWDPAAERVLWGRGEATGVPMASTTKIMTTLLALEAGTLDDEVTVSARAASAGGASLGLRGGQRLPMRSLLAGLMLRSGNDAAEAVAEHVAGSVEAFVRRMNARAAELGMRQTHFVNPSGLTDDRGHRASPLDLARLTKVAMAHEEFAAWVGAPRLTVPGLPPLVNRNELVGRSPGVTGVKTGYLSHAGYALVASADRDGLELYAVVLGSDDNFGDAQRLFDWAYGRYRLARPAAPGDAVGTYRWSTARVPLLAEGGLAAAVRRDAVVAVRLALDPWAQPPVEQGAVLGDMAIVEDGRVIARTALVAADAVADPALDPAGGGPAAGAGRAVQDALRAFARAAGAERAA